jgi:hypothetical protein
MVSIRKDHASPPARVVESWHRIESWLGEHLPILKLSLRAGISTCKSLTRGSFGSTSRKAALECSPQGA